MLWCNSFEQFEKTSSDNKIGSKPNKTKEDNVKMYILVINSYYENYYFVFSHKTKQINN